MTTNQEEIDSIKGIWLPRLQGIVRKGQGGRKRRKAARGSKKREEGGSNRSKFRIQPLNSSVLNPLTIRSRLLPGQRDEHEFFQLFSDAGL